MNIKSKTYAQALWENVQGHSLEDINEVLDVLHTMTKLYRGDKQVRDFLNHPRIETEAKVKLLYVLMKAVNAPEWVGKFVALLLAQRQLGQLTAILRHVEKIRNEHFGVLQTRVTTATTLSENQKKDLTDTLQKTFHSQKVMLEEATDPAILGGVVLHVNDTVIDTSLKRKLQQLQEALHL